MKKFFFDCGTRDAQASLGLLALRIMVGLMMIIGHGVPKIYDYAQRKEFFYVPDFFPFYFMTPAFSLAACIFAEVVAAACIVIGFATRPAAFILGFAMIVAAFGFLGAAPWFVKPPTIMDAKELSLMYLIPMIALILTGAGSYSLDSMLYRDTKRRRW